MGWRRILYLLCVAGCLAFYMMYRMWLSGLILVFILALPWFSLLVSLPGMLTLSLTLTHPAAVTAGEAVGPAVNVKCPLPAPPVRGWLEAENAITAEQWDLKFDSSIPTRHCGQLGLRLRGCWVYDYLGLFRLPIRKKPRGELLVRPAALPLPETPDLSRLLNRAWRPKRGGGFGENHELRLYRPGDSLQQIHWKLTAKTGKLILRETVEPEQGRLLVKLDLSGTDDELDRKLGQALWLGQYLLDNALPHTLRVLTGAGLRSWEVTSEDTLKQAVDQLLQCPMAESGTIIEPDPTAAWEYYIGGDGDET